ncbi:acyl-ACP--UDP-N-acetylglucosamine O-acyltransferase [candidate division WOR-3 bacterium]|nr:acyl-ACP--UDP-N-acetylglucosamine O-acyltransferase [candidate division WOR-3 bacterium]
MSGDDPGRDQGLKAVTSSISPGARIDPSVTIGPYCVIEDSVVIGEGTRIGSHVVIRSGTVIGRNNVISSAAQIGVDPQDYHFKGEHSYCVIGENNVIRECATISRATGEDCRTTVGNNNYIMTYVHIAHNNTVGDNVVISSIAQLGGHVEVGDHANIGGHTGIHQFCRVGRHAMLGAKSYLNKDLSPYLLASGNVARVHGLNTTGLLRRSFSWAEIEEIREIMRLVYRSNHSLAECQAILRKRNSCHAHEFLQFIQTSKRGILLKGATQESAETPSRS